jgi:8-oxo-dGTP pyrophosphatase MutT (NUDIX family)
MNEAAVRAGAGLPVSVKGVLFKNDDTRSEVLLLRNERQEWELPGGRVEPGETREACLKREFDEETGLKIGIGPYIGSGVLTIAPPHTPRVTNICIQAYGCHILGGSSPADRVVSISAEHQAWTWMGMDELRGIISLPTLYKNFILAWAEHLP